MPARDGWQVCILYRLHEAQRDGADVAQGHLQRLLTSLLGTDEADRLHEAADVIQTHGLGALGQVIFEYKEILLCKILWAILAELHDGLGVEGLQALGINIFDVMREGERPAFI